MCVDKPLIVLGVTGLRTAAGAGVGATAPITVAAVTPSVTVAVVLPAVGATVVPFAAIAVVVDAAHIVVVAIVGVAACATGVASRRSYVVRRG